MSDAVAIYSPIWLPRSETFVYRQLLGVERDCEPRVLTHELVNLDSFPYPRLDVCRRSLADRLYSRLARACFGRYGVMSPGRADRLASILRERRIKLIHAHFGPAGLLMLPIARRLDIPLLVTFHGYDASTLLRRASYRESLHALFEYASVIAVSNALAERLLDAGADLARLKVLRLGIPLHEFQYVARRPLAEKVRRDEPLRLLQVARLVEKKGTRHTLRAFAELLRAYPRCTLTIAGDGPLLSSMRRLAQELGLGHAVRFTGSIPSREVSRLMAESDACVQHSVTASDGDQEGLPVVLMEAMASGLPVVSTLHSGIPELVEDGASGYLVAERDEQAYAQKLRALLDDDGQIGRRARLVIEQRFDMEAQNRKLAAHYRAIGAGTAWNASKGRVVARRVLSNEASRGGSS